MTWTVGGATTRRYRAGMESATDQAVVNRIIEFLLPADDDVSGHLTGARELTQPVTVLSEPWLEYVAGMKLSEPVRAGVQGALGHIAAADNEVDRNMLTLLAGEADSGDEARVASWFATMSWGAGPTNNFRVRQWRRSMEQDNFLEVLGATARRVREGRLFDAHRGAWMPGTGEAFFTKWLWALGLPGIPGDVRPHVLDARVWNSLAALGWSPKGRNASYRWVDYCIALDRWADAIRAEQLTWTVDGDGVEQLLFERRRNRTDFYSWTAK